MAVVHWMGGVAFVTTVVLPAVSAITDPPHCFGLFEAIEHRFSAHVKVPVPIAGLSGAYMAERPGSWDRFAMSDGWCLMAMAVVWLAFMTILFVIEPFVLRDWFHHRAAAGLAGRFRLVQRAHWGLLAAGTAKRPLACSALTVFWVEKINRECPGQVASFRR